MTFVVYNNETGELIFTMNGTEYDADCLNVEIPDGMMIVGIDTETKEPIFEEIPMSMEERIALLEEQNIDQDDALVELSDAIFNL